MFTVQKDNDNIVTLEINAPGSANLIGAEFIDSFLPTIKKVFSDSTVKGIVITSGKKEFMAGGDLKFISSINSLDQGLAIIHKLHEGFSFLESQGKPVVALIAGSALGGGLELTLACHYRICVNDPTIQLSFPEVTLGLLPGGGGTQRLPRLIGIQPALELLTTGNRIDLQKALKLGLINELAQSPDAALDMAKKFILKTPQLAQPWADKKFKIPGGGVQSPMGYQVFAASNAMVAEKTYNNYEAPKAILNCVYEGLQVPFEMALNIEADHFVKLTLSSQAKNMIGTLFFSIQECNKGAARPQVPPSPCKKVGILGGGMMGSGIAYVSAKGRIPVVLKDVSQAAAQKGKDYSDKISAALIEKGRMTQEQKSKLLNLIQVSDDPKSVADCDLVIETVIEDRKIKAKVTQETEAIVNPKTIIASNTSTLPITGLAQASSRADQFIGLHFFSPVDKMPLVEIIMGQKTGEAALAKAIDFSMQIKKTPIVVNDGRGFYTSRVFMTYVSEGLHLLKDGVSPQLIENAGKMVGMPVGPLAVADEVSIDLMYHILKQTVEDLGSDHVDKVCYDISKLFVENLKRLGRKSKGGFYEYPPEGKKHLWPKLVEYFSTAKSQPPVQEVKDRLLTIQALESARCLEEGVLRSHRDGDVGSILGWGFPAYTGGTFSYIKTLGINKFIEKCQILSQKFGARFTPNKDFLTSDFVNEKAASRA